MDNSYKYTYGFEGWKDLLKNKKALTEQYIRYMMNRTVKMFEYTNLPDTIPLKDLEHLLQANGFAVIVKVDGDKGGLYAMQGGLGGLPNAYYLPTITTVNNPYLMYNAQLKIDEECVVMLNDSTYTGLMPMFSKYAQMLSESDITIRFALINARVQAIVYADNDKTKNDAKAFMKKVEEGSELGIIGGSSFFKGVQTQGFSSGSSTNIKDIMELQQYIKSQWFIDLGLDSNYNMKRESLNAEETGMNEDILLPLIDDMLEQRKIGVEKINKMFGTNIGVELSSAWKEIKDEFYNHDEEHPDKNKDEEHQEDMKDGDE